MVCVYVCVWGGGLGGGEVGGGKLYKYVSDTIRPDHYDIDCTFVQSIYIVRYIIYTLFDCINGSIIRAVRVLTMVLSVTLITRSL